MTTEYKPLDRNDSKPVDQPPAVPVKLPSALSHNQHRNIYELPSHNRLPTPENFPASTSPPAEPLPNSQSSRVDLEAPVTLSGYDDKDGVALMDFDFDSIPDNEKGWKKPGAHVADWFNYGFDETTWRCYVLKQKKLRDEESWATNPFAVSDSLARRLCSIRV